MNLQKSVSLSPESTHSTLTLERYQGFHRFWPYQDTARYPDVSDAARDRLLS